MNMRREFKKNNILYLSTKETGGFSLNFDVDLFIQPIKERNSSFSKRYKDRVG